MENLIDFTGFFDIDGIFRQYELCDMAVALCSFSEKARREGLLALEDDLEEMEHGIMKLMLMLIVDGTDPELVREIGETHMEQNITYLDGILQCVEYFLLSKSDKPDDRFSLICRSTVAASSETMLAEAFTQYKSFTTKGRAIDGENFPRRYRELLAVAASGADPDEKAHLFQNHLSSILAYNNALYQMIIAGTLAVQSGDNPRLVRDKLAGYLDPPSRVKLYEAIPQTAGE